MMTFLLSLLFGCVGAMTAHSRGRSAFTWFLLSMLFGWLALLALFLMPRYPKESRPDPTVVEVVTPPSTPVIQRTIPQCDWFYLDKEKVTCGPCSVATLREKWVKGEILSSTWVWHETLQGWNQIKKEPDLLEWLQKEKE
jgi:hypothetical protein